ncbi:MAG: hypothetical protein VYC34_12565 [Planctomycetota bacterium]|nr:hypothetical protein [Planctomycetota bacterium]
MTRRTARASSPWDKVTVVIIVLVLIGGAVAIAWSPLASWLLQRENSQPEPPPPSDTLSGAPGPDNSITEVPEDFDKTAGQLPSDSDTPKKEDAPQ